MYDFILVFSLFGFGVGYEGCDNGKYYFGTYTPTREYGWVVQDGEVYLDSVLEKTNVQY
jgi:hypothetical protein